MSEGAYLPSTPGRDSTGRDSIERLPSSADLVRVTLAVRSGEAASGLSAELAFVAACLVLSCPVCLVLSKFTA